MSKVFKIDGAETQKACKGVYRRYETQKIMLSCGRCPLPPEDPDTDPPSPPFASPRTVTDMGNNFIQYLDQLLLTLLS